jgi:hypothetical protein
MLAWGFCVAMISEAFSGFDRAEFGDDNWYKVIHFCVRRERGMSLWLNIRFMGESYPYMPRRA